MPFSNPKRWRIYVGYFTRLVIKWEFYPAIKWEFYVTWTKLQLHRILVCFQAWNYILAINELLIIERLGAYFIYNAFWLEEFSHKGGSRFSIPTVHKAWPLDLKVRTKNSAWQSCGTPVGENPGVLWGIVNAPFSLFIASCHILSAMWFYYSASLLRLGHCNVETNKISWTHGCQHYKVYL